MDVMQLRRNLLMQKKETGLNTSPKVAQYGVKNPSGNPTTKPYIIDENYCVTELYSYTPMNTRQTIRFYGGDGNAILYTDTTYKDYWNFSGESREQKWSIITANTNQITCTLKISMLDDCYLWLEETGEILFAGKNSIYYGHKNISELN